MRTMYIVTAKFQYVEVCVIQLYTTCSLSVLHLELLTLSFSCQVLSMSDWEEECEVSGFVPASVERKIGVCLN